MASRTMLPYIFLFIALTTPISAQDTADADQPPWSWLMADSTDSKPVCPGRCLTVNDSSGISDYENKSVLFTPCKVPMSSDDSDDESGEDPTSESTSTVPGNTEQKWVYTVGNKPTTIQINASEAQSPQLFCLHPDATNRSLMVSPCTTANPPRRHTWLIANATIASLAFDPPRYIAMSYSLGGFLDTNGSAPWRQANLVTEKTKNSTVTTVVSSVNGTDMAPRTPKKADIDNSGYNYVLNGGFEETSYDWSARATDTDIDVGDPFRVCGWTAKHTTVRMSPSGASQGNWSLYLNNGFLSQKVPSLAGAFFLLSYKAVASAPLASSDNNTPSSSSCTGTDDLFVGVHPSNVVSVKETLNNVSMQLKTVFFQADGNETLVTFRECGSCGCRIDDVVMLKVMQPAPFPPPPTMPNRRRSPMFPEPPVPGFPKPGYQPLSKDSKIRTNIAIGLVVGSAALFFMIGGACVAVIGSHRKPEPKEISETVSAGGGNALAHSVGRRPTEWSIHTSTPPRSGQSSINMVAQQNIGVRDVAPSTSADANNSVATSTFSASIKSSGE